jgi:hypothetical protein
MPFQTPTNDHITGPSVSQANGASTFRKHILPSPSFVRDNLGLIIGAFGFAAGCVFWHYVGFWALIHAVFYTENAGDRAADLQIPSQSQPKSGTTPMSGRAKARTDASLMNVSLTAENCTSLIFDRTNGVMLAAPCAIETMQLKSLRVGRKEDRRMSVDEAKSAAARVKPAAAPAVASWSSKVMTAPAN